MSIIYILIPIAVLFVALGLLIFFWAVRSKQFDDLDKEGFSILFTEQHKASPTVADGGHSIDPPADADTTTVATLAAHTQQSGPTDHTKTTT
jgi:cbb3-type cytochrome oxidase maturation protein